MFKLFTGLVKTAVRVAVTPVAVVADAVTLGGQLTDNGETYTGEQLRKIKEDFDEALED